MTATPRPHDGAATCGDAHGKLPESSKERRPYSRPVCKRHNDIVTQTQLFDVQGPPMPGPPAAAMASPTVPGATVF